MSLDYLGEVKIIASSDDSPYRHFMPLSFHRLRLSKEGDIDLDGEFGDAATAGFSAYEKMIQLGKAMQKENSKKVPTDLAKLAPSNSRCMAYVLLLKCFYLNLVITLCSI